MARVAVGFGSVWFADFTGSLAWTHMVIHFGKRVCFLVGVAAVTGNLLIYPMYFANLYRSINIGSDELEPTD